MRRSRLLVRLTACSRASPRWPTVTGWEATIHDFTGIDGNVDLEMAAGGNGVAVVVTDAPFNPPRTFGLRLP